MDDSIKENIARAFIKTIGPKNIGKGANAIFEHLIKLKSDVPLQPGETDIIGIIYEINGIAHFAQCAIRDNEAGKVEITRYILVKPIPQLVELLINNM